MYDYLIVQLKNMVRSKRQKQVVLSSSFHLLSVSSILFLVLFGFERCDKMRLFTSTSRRS